MTKISETKGVVSQRAVPGPALYQVTVVPESARAVVGILHGYAEHGARYAHVQQAWAEKGLASVAIDLRGHGRAEGARGYCDRFSEYQDDVTELARLVQDAAPKVPAFLFGHSFGGLLAAWSTLADARSWRALLLSDPYFKLALEVPGPKRFAAKIASRIYPKLALPSGLSGKDLTHDAAKARAYDEDPLVFPKATARWFTEASKAQQTALDGASRLKMPLYMLLGLGDIVASPVGGRTFFERAGSADKKLDERPGLFHEVLNEPEWRGIADAMADWMLAHV